MHRQIDGITMGSLLSPTLVNIFVGCQEVKLFNIAKRLLVYFQYVDDTFVIFNNDKTATLFSPTSTPFIPHYTSPTKRIPITLPFLDVLVERHDLEFLISVYRKPTFTGQYLHCNSFNPQKQKINLIGTLVHSAFMICSKSKLDPELGKIHSILLENGYLEHAINLAFKRKL